LPLLEAANTEIHASGPTFGWHPDAWLGLLISPSRGLLVFSPIVLVTLAALPAVVRERARSPLFWCAAAFAAQFLLFASYSVWWGGHTYGPRYLVDVLPLTIPLAAEALSGWRARTLRSTLAAAALVWSIVVAGTGAFCYPYDAWNQTPVDVDRDHRRLWSIRDNQVRRCWETGLSPQNFALFSHAAVRAAD
jgi:hypothetical protein